MGPEGAAWRMFTLPGARVVLVDVRGGATWTVEDGTVVVIPLGCLSEVDRGAVIPLGCLSEADRGAVGEQGRAAVDLVAAGGGGPGSVPVRRRRLSWAVISGNGPGRWAACRGPV